MNSGFKRWPTSASGLLICVVLALGVIVVPATVMAEEAPSQDEGLEALRAANDAFDDEDFETAYENYVTAYEVLGIDMVKYRMGQTAEKIGEVALAVEHYEAYREIGDDEEFLARIDAALPELRKKLPGALRVSTEPSGATVYIVDDQDPDGREVGTTPTVVEYDPGPTEFVVRLDGYREMSTTEELVAGEEHSWEVTLQAAQDSDAPRAIEPVAVDDRDVGVWGWTSVGIGAGVLAVGGVMSFFQADATNQVNELDRSAAGAGASAEEIQAMRDQQQALKSDAHGYYQAAMGSYIAGGLLLAAGAGILVYDRFDDSSEAISLRAGLGPDGGFFGLSGRF